MICIHLVAARRNVLNVALPGGIAACYLQQFLHLTKKALLTPATAYHIAFGPHGPRAASPPGEGMQIFKYVLIGVASSVALFYFTRIFARGPPKTMSAEWQEASNAYLKVRLSIAFRDRKNRGLGDIRMILTPATEREHRTHHRYFLRRLQGPRYGSEQEDRPGSRASRGRRRRRIDTIAAAIMETLSFVKSRI